MQECEPGNLYLCIIILHDITIPFVANTMNGHYLILHSHEHSSVVYNDAVQYKSTSEQAFLVLDHTVSGLLITTMQYGTDCQYEHKIVLNRTYFLHVLLKFKTGMD